MSGNDEDVDVDVGGVGDGVPDDVGDGVPDDSICPVCRGTTYVGETISCETCLYWFHFECVGVTHSDACVIREDVPYFCPKCTGGSGKSKSKKAKKKAKKAEKSPLKLKITLGPPQGSGVTSGTPTVKSVSGESLLKKRSSKKAPDPDEEEEKWLDAVEAGDVDNHVDSEMKNIKDPKLMTARQRALAAPKSEGGEEVDDGHISLDYGRKRAEETDEMDTIEFLRQKAIKSAKRREVEMVKREVSKQKTMDRLLKKKDSKVKAVVKTKAEREEKVGSVPLISYIRNSEGFQLRYPVGEDYPMVAANKKEPPKQIKCGVCRTNPKLYNCSKTQVPLCSLTCYKINFNS